MSCTEGGGGEMCEWMGGSRRFGCHAAVRLRQGFRGLIVTPRLVMFTSMFLLVKQTGP